MGQWICPFVYVECPVADEASLIVIVNKRVFLPDYSSNSNRLYNTNKSKLFTGTTEEHKAPAPVGNQTIRRLCHDLHFFLIGGTMSISKHANTHS